MESEQKVKKARPWDILNKNIEKLMPEQQAVRLEICMACPELIQFSKQCKKCGCFMEGKTRLPHASCPIGKWHTIDVPITKEIEG